MLKPNYTSIFGDVRLERRGEQLSDRLFWSGSRSIQRLSLARAEQKAFYNLLKNKKVTEEKLIDELAQRCKRLAMGKVVLSIQDTTEINLSRHSNRINRDTGIGNIGKKDLGQIGFHIHPSLVVDAQNCFPLGFSDIYLWNRSLDAQTKHDRKYKDLAVEQKESYRWIDSSTMSKQCLEQAEAVVIIQDREGDIFEQIERIPDQKTFLLIRSQINRRLKDGDHLWDVLNQAPLSGCYSVFIDSDSHSKEPSRHAEIEVRFVKTEIAPPYKNRNSHSQTLYAIEAREINSIAAEPVHWRLVSTWPVEDYATACMIIQWYTWRWIIEEMFRMLKKEGFDIEGSELENGWAIRKLCIMLLDTILKLLQMHIAYNTPEEGGPEIQVCFDEQQKECLSLINQKLQGKTSKLKNPYAPDKLKWAVWIIARSGGWKGYTSQRPPGMTTLFNGLQRFNNIMDGWNLLKDMGTR